VPVVLSEAYEDKSVVETGGQAMPFSCAVTGQGLVAAKAKIYDDKVF